MPLELMLALVGFSVASSVTPGPNNLMLLASGVNFGFRRTLPHMLGIGGGFAFLLLCVGFGLGAVLQQAPALHLAIKVVGVVYLLYLAWKIATGKGAMPGWKGVLTEAQIWHVVNYLKSISSHRSSGRHGARENRERHR